MFHTSNIGDIGSWAYMMPLEKQSKVFRMPKGGKRNGAGRKPGVPNKVNAEIKALAQQHTAASMKELARIALKGTSDTARVVAIREIFDRGYGRAIQSISGDPDRPHKLEISWKSGN